MRQRERDEVQSRIVSLFFRFSSRLVIGEAKMTESVSRVSVSQASAFDVNRVDQAFAAALRDSSSSRSAIGTQDYINGYRELLK